MLQNMYKTLPFLLFFVFDRYFDFVIINAKIVTLYKYSRNHVYIHISRLCILLFKRLLTILSLYQPCFI